MNGTIPLIGILVAATVAAAQHSAVVTLPDSIVEPGTKVEWVKKVSRYCEGPATAGSTLVYFTEQHANSDPNWPIWKVDLGNLSDTGTRWLQTGQRAPCTSSMPAARTSGKSPSRWKPDRSTRIREM